MMRADLRQTQKFGNVCTNSHLQQLLQSLESKFSCAFVFFLSSIVHTNYIFTNCRQMLGNIMMRFQEESSSFLCYTRSKYEGES